jgi:hypothetical protein
VGTRRIEKGLDGASRSLKAMPWIQLRRVICTPDAQAEAGSAIERFPRFKEMWQGLHWLLERNPEPPGSFRTTYHDKPYIMYCVDGIDPVGTPNVNLVYEYNDEEVQIHGVNAISPSPDEDG